MSWLVLVLVGCGSDCVELPDSCDPLYEPTFDNVFTNTLQPTCGFEGGACHSADGAQGGLVFEEIEESYDLVMERVLEGDPACSLLIQRVDAEDAADGMPPGDPLSEEERCAIRTWIEDGAQR